MSMASSLPMPLISSWAGWHALKGRDRVVVTPCQGVHLTRSTSPAVKRASFPAPCVPPMRQLLSKGGWDADSQCGDPAVAAARGGPGGLVVPRVRSVRGLLLLLGAECRHPATGAKGVHHLGSREEAGDLHGAAEVRGQRPGLRHG